MFYRALGFTVHVPRRSATCQRPTMGYARFARIQGYTCTSTVFTTASSRHHTSSMTLFGLEVFDSFVVLFDQPLLRLHTGLTLPPCVVHSQYRMIPIPTTLNHGRTYLGVANGPDDDVLAVPHDLLVHIVV